MADDWILDVLADLSDFARRNEMLLLVDELQRARVVAREELAARQARLVGDGGETFGLPG